MVNSLGFDKKPEDTRVVVAMSGGVDSSVVAAMLHAEGYEVIGITLQLYDHGAAIEKKGACCAGKDIYDARNVADTLGFPHYVLDYESRFSETVIEDFADSYLRGETPVPCIRCNQTVKFYDLLKQAHELGADCLATGHYVQRMVGEDGRTQLVRGADNGKDQSYFLFATTQEQLDFLRFPLGGMQKSETRALAEKFGLTVADKPDSQDICFVPAGKYSDLVKKLRPNSSVEGDIVHLDGRVMGRHTGIVNYTIGQRKGLGIGGQKDSNDPFYVVRLDAGENRVIVGPKEALAMQTVHIKELNWLSDKPEDPREGIDVQVKLRSAQQPSKATVYFAQNDYAQIVLETPEYGIAPGQAAVFYNKDRCLGGGWIFGAENKKVA